MDELMRFDEYVKKHLNESNDEDEMREFGFSLGVGDEYQMKENAEEDGIEIDWKLMNKDIQKIERNIVKALNKMFKRATDQGHDRYDNLIGAVWTDDPKLIDKVESLSEPLTTSSGYFWNWFKEKDIFKGIKDTPQSGLIDISLTIEEED